MGLKLISRGWMGGVGGSNTSLQPARGRPLSPKRGTFHGSNKAVVLKQQPPSRAGLRGGLDGYWGDEGRGGHCCSGGGLLALVSQRQDVLLQVGDPLGLDRQRTLEDLVTEPAAK